MPEAPGWADVVGWCALATALGAILLGLASLAVRRWFVALVRVAASPAALLSMVASTCVFC